MQIAFFDFDGTITTKDSFMEFIKYSVGNTRFALGFALLSPILLLYKFKVLANWRAKEMVLQWFFGGMPENDFRELANRYSRDEVSKIVRPMALEKIQWHLTEGHKVVVVSASIDCWLQEWCRLLGLDLIATRLEFINGRFIGTLSSKNCFGPEKVVRIKERYNLSDYQRIYAYGDSSGDLEMLKLAHEKFFCWEKMPD